MMTELYEDGEPSGDVHMSMIAETLLLMGQVNCPVEMGILEVVSCPLEDGM